MSFPQKSMQSDVRELNGIFQIHRHDSSVRFLWIIFVLLSIFIGASGVWMAKANVFVFSQDATLKHLYISLAFFIVGVVPTLIIFFGFIKVFKKPGIYLRGVRVANRGVEIGTLTLDLTSLSSKEMWEDMLFNSDVSGEWQSAKEIRKDEIKIIIILRKIRDLPNRFFLDQIAFFSKGKCVYQMFGFDIYSTKSNKLVALSQGALYLLANNEGFYPEEVFSFREKMANIISRWRFSFALTCTLKTMPRLENLNNVLALGMLGGVITTSVTDGNCLEYREINICSPSD